MSDPSDLDTMNKLQFILDKEIVPVLATREQINEAINRHYGQTDQESVEELLQDFTSTQIDFVEDAGGREAAEGEGDAPVIELVNLMIEEAVNLRASDIHVEPFVDRVRVRYRVDGVMPSVIAPAPAPGPDLARIKVMGSIDIAEKRRPQDGRIKFVIGGQQFDLRVSVLPTVHGQSVVMRILDRGNIPSAFRTLGSPRTTYARFQKIIDGPTASFWSPGRPAPGRRPPSTRP